MFFPEVKNFWFYKKKSLTKFEHFCPPQNK